MKIINHLKADWFRYAFETIAVIIGILVAFALDNWNEKRNSIIETDKFLIGLKNDLVHDTIMLNRVIDLTTHEYNSSRNIDIRIFSPEANFDTIVNIAKSIVLGIEAINGINVYHTSTFQILESTGKLEFFDEEIKYEIVDTYLFQKQTQENQSDYQNSYFERIGDYIQKYRFNEELASEGDYVYELLWRIEDEREFVTAFTDLNGFRTFTMSLYLYGYNLVLDKTKRLIIHIEEIMK